MGVHYGRLASFVFAVCCCLAVVSIVNIAFAATNTELMYGRMHGGNVTYKSAAQLRLEATYNHSFQKVPDQVARYVPKNKTFSVTYTQAQLRGMVKGVGKNTAVYATVVGAVAAAGWAIDELTGQITRTVQPEPYQEYDTEFGDQYFPNFRFVYNGHYGNTACQAAKNSAISSNFHTFLSCTSTELSGTTSRRVDLRAIRNTSTSDLVFIVPRQSCSSGQVGCQAPDLITITPPAIVENVPDSDFDIEIKPKVLNLPNHQLETGLLRDTQGNPKITPQLDEALRDWLQDIANRSPDLTFDPNTRSLTYTDPQTQEITEIQTQPDFDPVTDSTESNFDPKGLEWPEFCDWATIVCELADFIMGEPDDLTPAEIPFEDINLADVHQDFNSGLGSGSCPAPISFSYGGYSGDYEFATACFAAETYFKPILLTMAAIMAGFIIVGATRKGV